MTRIFLEGLGLKDIAVTRQVTLKLLLIVCSVLFAQTPVLGKSTQPLEATSFPSLISSVRVNAPLDFCEEPVPLEQPDIRERLEKELLLTLWGRPQVVLWIKRSNRYIPLIEKMLKQSNMPDDLKYVAIVESALRPHVGSRKGAIGFWQFIKSTGQKYGLIINKETDQRRNIFASTMGAIRYFKELHEKFGSWTLAAAAYNMGEQGLEKEILVQNTDRYYHLYLPLETQRYIFRIISAKLILTDPETYGFRFKEEDLYPLFKFERIRIESPQTIPILIVAQAAKTTFKVIKDYNPEIRGHHIPKGTHTILIPKGHKEGFHARYQTLLSRWMDDNQRQIYVVKKGDNLSSIAERFNLPLPVLTVWNNMSVNTTIHPGDELVIFLNKTKQN